MNMHGLYSHTAGSDNCIIFVYNCIILIFCMYGFPSWNESLKKSANCKAILFIFHKERKKYFWAITANNWNFSHFDSFSANLCVSTWLTFHEGNFSISMEYIYLFSLSHHVFCNFFHFFFFFFTSWFKPSVFSQTEWGCEQIVYMAHICHGKAWDPLQICLFQTWQHPWL